MPDKCHDSYGRVWTGQYRLRPTLLGVKLEQLVEQNDGSKIWMKAPFPVEIGKARNSTE